MRKKILFHIGYHKTATTWMQRLLFTPNHGYRQLADHVEVFRNIVQPHGLEFSAAAMQRLIAVRLKGIQAEETPVVSSEVLSGHPFNGGRESEIFAERIFSIEPRAKVLISIRSQLRILPSVYMQYLRRGGTMPWEEFFKGTDEPGYFGFSARHFEYDALVARYQQLFGSDNVFVVTQESLQKDMNDAACAIARFSGNARFEALSPEALQVNAASYPEYAAPILRRINHIQRSTLNPHPIFSLGSTPAGLYKLAGYALRKFPLPQTVQGRKPISEYVHRRFGGQFSKSNDRLRQIITHRIDLSDYD